MSKTARFVIWICSKFNRDEILQIINGLLDVLNNRNPEVKPKDDFKEKRPNYRKFSVDPLPPLTKPPLDENKAVHKDYKELLVEYEAKNGKPLSPVKHRSGSPKVQEVAVCPLCNAPHNYIYFNDGKKMSQLKCKVCGHLFQLNQRFRKHDKAKFFCPHRIQALNRLNSLEKDARNKRSSQFKLCYQYREYHYKPGELIHSQPDKPTVDISKIHNSPNVLGLVLAFYVSFAVSARKTALIMNSVFNVNVSYQTVLNYAAAAAFHCHSFNTNHKGPVDDIQAGDETYIKIKGKHNYVFFFISSKSLKLTAYHVADNRGAQPAIIAMNEAVRTGMPEQVFKLITDGNPSYPAGIHFINSQPDEKPDIKHNKVIGIQNLDKESEEYRPLKQLIERLNRTFKYHVRPAHGFNCSNGAVALTTLFVTHYNFLRPHMSLGYKTPVNIPDLNTIHTIQGKWAKILSMAV